MVFNEFVTRRKFLKSAGLLISAAALPWDAKYSANAAVGGRTTIGSGNTNRRRSGPSSGHLEPFGSTSALAGGVRFQPERFPILSVSVGRSPLKRQITLLASTLQGFRRTTKSLSG